MDAAPDRGIRCLLARIHHRNAGAVRCNGRNDFTGSGIWLARRLADAHPDRPAAS